MFVGVYERQLDERGRVALPSSYRGELGDHCYLFFGDDGCVSVRSVESFEAEAAELVAKAKRGEVSRNRQRAFASSAAQATIDKQGRVTLDARLREHAGLAPQAAVVVLGNIDQIEIWDPETHRRNETDGPVRDRRRGAVSRDDGASARLRARTGDGRRDHRRVRDRAGGHRRRCHARRWRSQRGTPRRRATTSTCSASIRTRTPSRPPRPGWRATATGVRTSRRRFDELDEALAEHGVERISGALFDLGVSSPQLDRADRGFSYRHDGPLDMRMDADQTWSADDVVNGYAESDLARIIQRYGDERFAVADRPGDRRRPPDPDDDRAGRGRDDGDPGGGPAHRRSPRQAHLPGDPHRGQRRARRAARRTRPGRRGDPTRRAHRRAVVPLGRGPHRQGALRRRPPVPATVPTTCRACAVRSRPCASCAASRSAPSDAERQRNRRAASARLRVVERVEPIRKSDGQPVEDR